MVEYHDIIMLMELQLQNAPESTLPKMPGGVGNTVSELRSAQAKEQEPILIGFQTTPYVDFERGTYWYIVTLLVIGSLVYYSLLQYAWSFAALLLVFSGTYFAFLVQPMKVIPFAITEHAIKYNKKRFEYSQFTDFWIEFLQSGDNILHLHFESRRTDLKILLPKDINISDLEITLMQNLAHSRDRSASFLDTLFYLLRL